MKEYQLGEFEEIVLLTVAILHEEAYGVSIKEDIEERLKRSVSVSALQTALRRMEKKDYLKSELGEATAIRGGKRKRYFKVTKTGKAALDYAKETRQKLWSAIPDVSYEYVKAWISSGRLPHPGLQNS
ncbi:Transcriptional regulator PadR-like family protein [Ekhidna lutea]|uniref:Transcriptional regulator PadR-like family protein n=1 Tax=Ekhidna lutea TaxID=447679 RepID=A0A239HTK3_EKHLU|nr:helix-turn-helix transcriptional regulator [Ekhidna lutea]SNS84408.1 Transcriptional regulator PadR-like family protein [Ekhidna lutea]